MGSSTNSTSSAPNTNVNSQKFSKPVNPENFSDNPKESNSEKTKPKFDIPDLSIKSSLSYPDLIKKVDLEKDCEEENSHTVQEILKVYKISDEEKKLLPKSYSYIFQKINEGFCPTASTNNNFDLLCDHINQKLIKSGLISTDNIPKSTKIKLKSGEIITIGEHKNGKKITPLGHAYFKAEEKKQIDNNVLPLINSLHNYKFEIAIAPQDNFNEEIPNGKKHHLLIVLNLGENKSLIIGFLTSKKTDILLNDIQYKNYEKNQEEIQQSGKDIKKQFFLSLENAETIPTNELVYPMYGENYLVSCNQDVFFQGLLQQLLEKNIFMYDRSNYTMEQIWGGLARCIYNIEKGLPHPLTKIQLENINLAKEKQKAKQLEEKNKKFSTHDKNPHEEPNDIL